MGDRRGERPPAGDRAPVRRRDRLVRAAAGGGRPQPLGGVALFGSPATSPGRRVASPPRSCASARAAAPDRPAGDDRRLAGDDRRPRAGRRAPRDPRGRDRSRHGAGAVVGFRSPATAAGGAAPGGRGGSRGSDGGRVRRPARPRRLEKRCRDAGASPRALWSLGGPPARGVGACGVGRANRRRHAQCRALAGGSPSRGHRPRRTRGFLPGRARPHLGSRRARRRARSTRRGPVPAGEPLPDPRAAGRRTAGHVVTPCRARRLGAGRADRCPAGGSEGGWLPLPVGVGDQGGSWQGAGAPGRGRGESEGTSPAARL